MQNLFRWLRFNQTHTQFVARRSYWVALLLGSFGILAHPTPARAADQLVVTYGPLNADVSVADLEKLVNTSEVPGSLRFYLGLANIDPATLRNLLTMELDANSSFMNDMLSSESGNHLLSQLSQVVHLPPNRPDIQVLKSANQDYTEPSEAENIEALKTALIKSADDRHVTILEVIQHYPAQKVYVDAVRLMHFADSLKPH
jgi:hypothetical protein